MNKNLLHGFSFLTTLLTAASMQAAPLASTSLGGTAAAPTGDTGFSSTIWASTAGGGTASSATFTPGDQGVLPAAYTGSGLTNTGNYITTSGTPAFRTLSTGIANEAPTTRYFSFLYSIAGSSNALNGGGLSFFNGTTEIFQVGIGTDGVTGSQIRVNNSAVGGTATYTSSPFATGTDVLWIIGKIDAAVGDDTVSIRFYKGADALSATEDFTGTQSTTNSFSFASGLNTIRFNSPGGQLGQRFDEFRLGDSFASVVPEPSTGALVLAGVCGLVMRRRSIRS